MSIRVPLPQSEVALLAALAASGDKRAFHGRLRALWDAGWSLSVLGNALSPKRPRATVHYWVRNVSPVVQSSPVPSPFSGRSLVSVLGSSGVVSHTVAPTVTPELSDKLRELSLQARRYRSRTSDSNRFAVANREFTELIKELRAQGIPAVDIAKAAGISYRAVARRAAK